MRRLPWLDRLRGAAILAVVVLHAELQAVGATGTPLSAAHEVNALLAPVRMPLLVLLSGILLTPALAKPPRRYLSGKAQALLWPYLVWSAIDVGQLQLRLLSRGESLTWDWVLRVVYAPPTYLWFLAYLFVYYVVSLALPGRVRAVGALPLLALALLVPDAALPDGVDRLVWLFGWFLAGDTLGRAVRRHLRPVPVPPHDVLGFVGRHSLVFYVSHLVVAIFVTDRLVPLGVTDPWTVFAACVGAPLAAGLVLVRGRRHPVVDALFTWPGRTVEASTESRALAATAPRSTPRGG